MPDSPNQECGTFELKPLALVSIYALSDPREDVCFENIRYVGKTEVSLRKRRSGHIKQGDRDGNYRWRWISKLLASGVEPIIWPLEICNQSNWPERERWWIKRLRPIARLTNGTEGGDGMVGSCVTDEVRKKLSLAAIGKKKPPFTPEHIQKFRAAKLGKPIKKETIAKIVAKTRGLKRSEEFCRRLSEINKNAPPPIWLYTPESREKARIANTGKKRTQETCNRIRVANSKPVVCVETGAIYESSKYLASIGVFGVSRAIKNNLTAFGNHWMHYTGCTDGIQYEKSKPPYGGPPKRPTPKNAVAVMCVETGKIYTSISRAASENGVTACAVLYAARTGGRSAKLHWKNVCV